MQRKGNTAGAWRKSLWRNDVPTRWKNFRRVCTGSIAYISVALFLTGCSFTQSEVVENNGDTVVEDYVWTPMYEYTESIVFDSISVQAITPCTHMEVVDTELRIFPYFDYDEYISMKTIVLSGNDLYTQAIRNLTDDDNFVSEDNRNWFYFSNKGATIGVYKIDDNSAYYIETNKFPSSYVALVLDELNKILRTRKGEK